MRVKLSFCVILTGALCACGPSESTERQTSTSAPVGSVNQTDDSRTSGDGDDSSTDDDGDDTLTTAIVAEDITGAYLTCVPMLTEDDNELFGCGYRQNSDDALVEADCGAATTLYGLDAEAEDTGELTIVETMNGDEPFHVVFRLSQDEQATVVGVRAEVTTTDAGTISKQTASYLESDERWADEMQDYRDSQTEAIEAIKDKVDNIRL